MVASPDTTGGRTITGPDAKPAIDAQTGLASISPPAPPSSSSGGKTRKIRREKIRFGQAPQNSLPTGTDDATATTADGGVIARTAPDVANSPQQGTSASGTSPVESANLADNPLTPKAPERQKTRFAAKAKEVKENKVAKISAKQQEKLSAKPEPMTAEQKTAAQVQAAPLGVAGVDAAAKPKKVKKPKRVKGQPKPAKAPKERLAEKAPVAPVAAPTVAPTANPALAPMVDRPAATPKPPPSADRTTMPSNVTPPHNLSQPERATGNATAGSIRP